MAGKEKKAILPANAHKITQGVLAGLDDDDDGLVMLSPPKKSSPLRSRSCKDKDTPSPKTNNSENNGDDDLEFEMYDSAEDDSAQENATQHIHHSPLPNDDTHITTSASTGSASDASNDIANTTDALSHMSIAHPPQTQTQTASNGGGGGGDRPPTSAIGSPRERPSSSRQSRTMEQWLRRDSLIVFPVWIGNLPRGTTVDELRSFVEGAVGRALVSVHISAKQSHSDNQRRTYAFLNMPTAEKQQLALTLLENKVFRDEKLIVRTKRPSKFPQSFFGSSPISEHFKHFRDAVVPSILANPTMNLNVTSVRKIMEERRINIDVLPNRVWCVQCTLMPQCHRTYCSFYHCHQEKELGRIISILAAQSCGDRGNSGAGTNASEGAEKHAQDLAAAANPNTVRSRHTLLIQGLPRCISAKKIEETFEVFGRIDNVLGNADHTCYVRMKRSQDARKIVHLFKHNHAGVVVDFAPYGAGPTATDKDKDDEEDKDRENNVSANKSTYSASRSTRPQRLGLVNNATAPVGRANHSHGSHGSRQGYGSQHSQGRMSRPMFGNTPSDPLSQLPVTNPNGYQTQRTQKPGLRNAMSVNAGTYHHQQQQQQMQQMQQHSGYHQPQQPAMNSISSYHAQQQQQQPSMYQDRGIQPLQQQRSDEYMHTPQHRQQPQNEYRTPQYVRPRRMTLKDVKDVKSEPIPQHYQTPQHMNHLQGMYPQQVHTQSNHQYGQGGNQHNTESLPMSPQEYAVWYNEQMQQRQQRLGQQQQQQASQGYPRQTNGYAANTQSQGYANGSQQQQGYYQQQQSQQPACAANQFSQYSSNGYGQNNGLYANSQQAQASLSPLMQTPRSMQSQQSMPHTQSQVGQIGQVMTSPQSKFKQQMHSHNQYGQRPVMRGAYSEQLHQPQANNSLQTQQQRPLDDLCVTPRFASFGVTPQSPAQNKYSPQSVKSISSLGSIDNIIAQHQVKHTQQQNWMNSTSQPQQAQAQPATRFAFQPRPLTAAASESAAVAPPDLHFGLSGDPLSPTNVLNKPLMPMAARSCQ